MLRLLDLDRFSLEARLLIAFLLPLSAILWMTTSAAIERYQEVSNLHEVEALTQLAVEAGDFVHHLQVERGLSKGYLGSQGNAFRDALLSARTDTDYHFSQLRRRLDKDHYGFFDNPAWNQQALLQQFSLPGSALEEENTSGSGAFTYIEGDVASILDSLENLTEVRQQVDNLSAQSEEVVNYYTRINVKINHLTTLLAHQAQHAEITRKLAAYQALIMYKDLAGLERARVSHILTLDNMSATYRHALIDLWGEQRAFHSTFLRLADSAYGDKLLAARQHASHTDITRLRQILRENDIDTPYQAAVLPEAETWFSWQTEYIDQLKEVEDAQAAAIISWATEQRQVANATLRRYLLISTLSMLTALLLIYVLFRSIRLRLILADTIFHHTHDGMMVTDKKGNIVDTNRAFTTITGYSREEAKGKNPRIFHSGRQSREFYRDMWRKIKKDGTWQGEIWNRRKHGDLYAELINISAVRDKFGGIRNYIAIFSDITSQAKRHEQQLRKATYYDSLTGLPNRTQLLEQLRRMLHVDTCRRGLVTVAFINLDDFKTINEHRSYEIGDTVLQIMAKRFQAVLREGDILSRFGGNEFVVVLENVESTDIAMAILTRLHREAGLPIDLESTTLSCTASIGTTWYPIDDGNAETLLRHAKQALLDAKQKGRNRIEAFDLRLAEHQSVLSRLVQRLEQAMANDELVLHYQPKVDMTSGELLGVEALLRWEDPERGMVPPGEFLPYLEEHPISITIGRWVMETALAQIVEWRRQGLDTRISVNVSSLELHHPDFVGNIRDLLDTHADVPSDRIELEVLESTGIGDIKAASRVLHECRALGVKVSFDDFGTGYASLAYLKYMPADTLKIDQTFVRDMLTDSGDRMIVKAIVGLADTFGFHVIAEGVEEEAQGLALIELGCRQGQGFGIGRPMPADALLNWYRRWQPFPSWKR